MKVEFSKPVYSHRKYFFNMYIDLLYLKRILIFFENYFVKK